MTAQALPECSVNIGIHKFDALPVRLLVRLPVLPNRVIDGPYRHLYRHLLPTPTFPPIFRCSLYTTRVLFFLCIYALHRRRVELLPGPPVMLLFVWPLSAPQFTRAEASGPPSLTRRVFDATSLAAIDLRCFTSRRCCYDV